MWNFMEFSLTVQKIPDYFHVINFYILILAHRGLELSDDNRYINVWNFFLFTTLCHSSIISKYIGVIGQPDPCENFTSLWDGIQQTERLQCMSEALLHLILLTTCSKTRIQQLSSSHFMTQQVVGWMDRWIVLVSWLVSKWWFVVPIFLNKLYASFIGNKWLK